MHELFPVKRPFINENDFLTYKHKQDAFIFIIDLNQRIKELETALTSRQDEMKTVSVKVDTLLDELEKKVLTWIEKQIEIKEQELAKSAEELAEVEQTYRMYQAREEQLTREKPTKRNAVLAEIEMESEREKSKIMKTFKGRYTLNWKWERKSWQAAKAPMYFDTGKGYLFVQISLSNFEKIAIEEFVSRILKIATNS